MKRRKESKGKREEEKRIKNWKSEKEEKQRTK
jgi:hypothetical protein